MTQTPEQTRTKRTTPGGRRTLAGSAAALNVLARLVADVAPAVTLTDLIDARVHEDTVTLVLDATDAERLAGVLGLTGPRSGTHEHHTWSGPSCDLHVVVIGRGWLPRHVPAQLVRDVLAADSWAGPVVLDDPDDAHAGTVTK